MKVFYILFLFLLSGRLPVEMSVHAPIRPPGGEHYGCASRRPQSRRRPRPQRVSARTWPAVLTLAGMVLDLIVNFGCG